MICPSINSAYPLFTRMISSKDNMIPDTSRVPSTKNQDMTGQSSCAPQKPLSQAPSMPCSSIQKSGRKSRNQYRELKENQMTDIGTDVWNSKALQRIILGRKTNTRPNVSQPHISHPQIGTNTRFFRPKIRCKIIKQARAELDHTDKRREIYRKAQDSSYRNQGGTHIARCLMTLSMQP